VLRALVFMFALASIARADWPFPVTESTTWKYQFSCDPGATNGVVIRQIRGEHNPATVQIEETDADGSKWATVLKLQQGAVLAEETGVPPAQAEASGSTGVILPASLQTGTRWEYRGRIATIAVELPLAIVGEEEVQVPAGKFRAWHIHGQRTGALATTAEQWFVPGLGWVKEAVTQRSPTGELLARCTLELAAPPTAANTTANSGSPSPAAPPFEASLSTSTGGSPMDIISADALQIVARWRLLHSRTNAKVRVVWIAENTGGVVAPDYKIDEASTLAAAPDAVGTFTLSRPSDGWAPGKYRADFYVQDLLVLSRHITIVERAAPAGDNENR
jgi:hypothetical protein